MIAEADLVKYCCIDFKEFQLYSMNTKGKLVNDGSIDSQDSR